MRRWQQQYLALEALFSQSAAILQLTWMCGGMPIETSILLPVLSSISGWKWLSCKGSILVCNGGSSAQVCPSSGFTALVPTNDLLVAVSTHPHLPSPHLVLCLAILFVNISKSANTRSAITQSTYFGSSMVTKTKWTQSSSPHKII